MSLIAKAVVALVFMAAPLTTFGHPGHGPTEESSLWHMLSDPFHLVQGLLMVGVIFALGAMRRSPKTDGSLSP